MTKRDYLIYLEGMEAASRGKGVSDSPYGGRDGDLWRGGVLSWLDNNEDLPVPQEALKDSRKVLQ